MWDMSIPEEKKKTKKPKKKSTSAVPQHDGIYEYAKDTLCLGLLLLERIDAVREGDGDRIMRLWKFSFHFSNPQDVPIIHSRPSLYCFRKRTCFREVW